MFFIARAIPRENIFLFDRKFARETFPSQNSRRRRQYCRETFCNVASIAVGGFETMIDVRAIACLVLLTLGDGLRVAVAAPLDEAAEKYRPYMIEGIGQALSGARDLRERIAARDLAGARKAWISARAGWERSEVFTAGFVPELDAEIDAWPNAVSGFHAVEAKLFGAGNTDALDDADALVEHLDSLHKKLHGMTLTPQGLLDGTVRLAYEVGESKADGGESRISGTSLDDMRNNVAGIGFAYRTIFGPALGAADTKLAGAVDARIRQLELIVAALDLPHVDIPALRRASEELVVTLQSAAAKLGLQRATLEANLK
jgi:iron uptake system component EfeO